MNTTRIKSIEDYINLVYVINKTRDERGVHKSLRCSYPLQKRRIKPYIDKVVSKRDNLPTIKDSCEDRDAVNLLKRYIDEVKDSYKIVKDREDSLMDILDWLDNNK